MQIYVVYVKMYICGNWVWENKFIHSFINYFKIDYVIEGKFEFEFMLLREICLLY